MAITILANLSILLGRYLSNQDARFALVAPRKPLPKSPPFATTTAATPTTMTSKLQWIALAHHLPKRDSKILMQSFAPFKVDKSNLRPCNICTEITPHNKRSQLLSCISSTCKTASPYARCPRRGKLETCETLKIVTLAEIGAHVTQVRPPRAPRLTESMKAFSRELATQDLNPSRIRHGMLRRFDLDAQSLPKLSTVQRFVGNYKKRHLGFTDYHDLIVDKVRDAAYTGDEGDHVAFTFAWREKTDGRPYVGLGTDDDPFMLGLTSKRLLQSAARDLSTFVLHVDATFKLNSSYYPVVVVGISDRLRSFHLLALFIVSQRTEVVYVEMLAALRRIYHRVMGVQIKVNFVMADAEAAMYTAFERVFGIDNDYTHLMCWYHVVAKVYQHTNNLPASQSDIAMRDVFDMHFARGQAEFDQIKQAAIKRWASKPLLANFAEYFAKVWLAGRATRWQCYWTSIGYAKTNNPCEQFNKVLKRDYTHRRRQKVGALITLLLSCCTVESMKTAPFHQSPAAQTKLKTRPREMTRAGKVSEYVPKKTSIAFLVGDPLPPAADGMIRVVSSLCTRAYEVEVGKTEDQILVSAQVGVHTGRMELKDMPLTGWEVDINLRVLHTAFTWATLYASEVLLKVTSGRRCTTVDRSD